MKEPINTIPRRKFLKLAAISAGGVLAIGYLPGIDGESKILNISDKDVQGLGLNQYIFIDSSGKITLFNNRPEMGQGTFQSIPMILAEELEVDINKVEIMSSPADRSKYGDQMVVGSRSIASQFATMRKMGAAAKEMLIEAAANRWNLPTEECYAEDATVIHRPSGKKLSYGDLVEAASKLQTPQNPKLKDPKDFKIIGRSIPRRDIPQKTNGSAKFGIDSSVPGMLYASIERSPVFLGKIVSYNDEKAKAIPGVKYVFKTQRDVMGFNHEGVAVLADTYWAALRGRQTLEIKWDNGDLESWSTEKIKDNYKKASEQDGVVFEEKGNFKNAFADGKIKVEVSYETPYQSHAPMEPMNALVHVQKDKCEFWGSTQNPNGIRSQLAKQTGMPEENVIVHYTFMGGGFGRRSMTDVSEEATDLSMKSGAPVKVIWTREDDTTQGPYRACSLNVCKGVVDENGNPVALEHKVICQDIINQAGSNVEATGGIAGGINTEYQIPNYSIRGVLQKFYIPVSYWRSVYHSTNCFAHESFIDELAIAAKKDPVEFRLVMLTNHRRYTQVLKMVAEKTNWYAPRAKDTGMGVSIVERSGAFTAMVIEVTRVNGKVKIKKITAAIDCGTYVNPDTIKAQCEGSIIMGLTAVKSGITIDKGKVVEQNFDTYQLLRLNETPEIDVEVVKSTDPPDGAGESGLANVAPALTNAIFNLTGKRIRTLPFNIDDI